jgi:hypothetical protein
MAEASHSLRSTALPRRLRDVGRSQAPPSRAESAMPRHPRATKEQVIKAGEHEFARAVELVELSVEPFNGVPPQSRYRDTSSPFPGAPPSTAK